MADVLKPEPAVTTRRVLCAARAREPLGLRRARRTRRITRLERRPNSSNAATPMQSVLYLDNAASRTDPAGGRHKLPTAPGNPRNGRVGIPC